jgi:hypothetical protein
MWFKWLTAIVIISLIGIIVLEREDAVQQIQTDPILRSAQQIIMHEKKTDSDISTIIQAQRVVEQLDNVVQLDHFELSQSDGLHMTGRQAHYDTDKSILTVRGPLTINTLDGRKALLDGLVWNRDSQIAFTKNPVVVQGREGTIKANKAEFRNGFTQIRFLGGVHAQITQNILYN